MADPELFFFVGGGGGGGYTIALGNTHKCTTLEWLWLSMRKMLYEYVVQNLGGDLIFFSNFPVLTPRYKK